jgi:hypothetical protein
MRKMSKTSKTGSHEGETWEERHIVHSQQDIFLPFSEAVSNLHRPQTGMKQGGWWGPRAVASAS